MQRGGKGVSEFDLIRRLQEIICIEPSVSRPGPVVGIGDDGAVLALPANSQLVVSTDTLVENVHFLRGSSATDLGHKALAVNLSDLAAMGAEPAWFFLALTLPEIQPDWLEDFAQGMAVLAEDAGIQLAGGDVTSGPLSITITVLGLVERGQALRRTGARPGDLIVVSGTLGDAALALQAIAAGGSPDTISGVALNRPIPRLELGLKLRGLASSCIDVSDGLLADLGHILLASGKGAEIELDRLPCSVGLNRLSESERHQLQTAGGDDYELCFTIPPDRHSELKLIAKEASIRLTVVGEITAAPGLHCKTSDGRDYLPTRKGYEHFSREDI